MARQIPAMVRDRPITKSGESAASARHVATLALLDGVSAVVLALVGGALLHFALRVADDRTALALLAVGTACTGIAVLNVGLAWGLRSRSGVARRVQLVAAVAALPLIPIGSIWGVYSLWVLGPRRGRACFGQSRLERGHPYYLAVMGCVALGIACGTWESLRLQQYFLAQDVEWARDHESAQREAVRQSLQHLRELSADDFADEKLRQKATAVSERVGTKQ